MERARRFALTVLIGLALSLGWAGSALAQRGEPALTPDQEAEARTIEGLLMCPVCTGQTVRESQSPVAQEIRAKIRTMLAEGKTRQQILDYFVGEYGESILSEPPARGAGLVAWVAPALLLAAGAALLARFLRQRGASGAPPAARAPQAAPAGEVDPEVRRRLEERLRDYL